jgi:transcriptional regulator with XRE-family HTH domain
MGFFAQNLAYLRKQHGLSQQTLSDNLGIPRSTISGYEQAYAEPDIETLIKFSSFFEIDLDSLLTLHLENRSTMPIEDVEDGALAYAKDYLGGVQYKNQIELVDTKAEAGYMESFSDPEFIKELPQLHIPKIPRGKYRAFEVQGDSMLPLEPGSIVIGSVVENLKEIKSGTTYIVASNQGLVYKRVYNREDRKILQLVSDNDIYAPYELTWEEVREIWKFYACLSFSDGKVIFDSMLEEKQERLFKQMDEVHRKVCNS